MKKIVLDTNSILRLLLNDIPAQVEEVERGIKLAKLGKIKLIIPQIVIFEIVYALTKEYGFDKYYTASELNRLLATNYIEIQDRESLIMAVKIFATKKLSLVDCFIYCFARNKNADLFTFDKNLQKLAGK